jgi:hypothetical protein
LILPGQVRRRAPSRRLCICDPRPAIAPAKDVKITTGVRLLPASLETPEYGRASRHKRQKRGAPAGAPRPVADVAHRAGPMAATAAGSRREVIRAMVKCPFCQFDNEDGALFCEQCKSDLGGDPVEIAPPAAAPVVDPFTMPSPPPLDETFPLADTPGAGAPPVEEVPASAPDAGPPSGAPPATPGPRLAVAASPEIPGRLPPGAQPRLVVLRGQRINVDYPLYEGHNFIGRADEKPVDIDLEDQEPPDRIWSSRQHALITFEDGFLLVEDLNSSNGTFVNRTRVYPGQRRPLQANDVIQIGTVQLKVKI